MPLVKTIILVGCGAVSEILYASVLNKLVNQGECDDILLVDNSQRRIDSVCEKLPGAAVYRDFSEIKRPIDGGLVINALPHYLHASVSIKALKAGAHVLCEKPMARTVQDCDLMICAAETAGRSLAVGHFRRFFPTAGLIRDWIKHERLGKLCFFRFLEGEIYSWPAASASFFSREVAGGGVLIDAGVHTVDLLLWWIGAVDTLEYWDDAAGGVEANCVLKLQMQNGATGYVQMSRDWPLPNKYFLQFDHGWILYTCDHANDFRWGWNGEKIAQKSFIEAIDGLGFDRLPRDGVALPEFSRCFELQLINVLNAISANEPLMCSGAEARKAVALIERCYRERKPLQQNWLSNNEQKMLTLLARQ